MNKRTASESHHSRIIAILRQSIVDGTLLPGHRFPKETDLAEQYGVSRMTVRQALAAGATKREIAETIFQMSMFGGLPAMQKALEIAQSVYAEEDEE